MVDRQVTVPEQPRTTASLSGALDFLLPETDASGWHASRNALKPLNHLALLRQKEETAITLNLHSIRTPPEVFEKNFMVLEQHQRGALSTAYVIRYLSEQEPIRSRATSPEQIRALLWEYASIGHMEFHPTDICNLGCTACTYGHDDPTLKPPPVHFAFDKIERAALFRPRSIVIVGGGEPTLYRDGTRRFQDVVDLLSGSNPGVALALSTNGTYKPPGPWPDRMSWIRVSVDAATEETYAGFRGARVFNRVLTNFLKYLEHDVAQVGVSFVFGRSNVHEYADVAQLVYTLVKKHKPNALHRVNVQYRPLRQDPHATGTPFSEAITPEDIARTVERVKSLAATSSELEAFLRNQTNVTAILGGNAHVPREFRRCHYTQAFRMVRANGDLRPCFVRVVEPDFILGNVYRDDPPTVALNALYIATRRKPGCDPQGCRLCNVNNTFERGLRLEALPSTSPDVVADPMF